MDMTEQLHKDLDYLNLPHLRDHLDTLAKEAAMKKVSHFDFLASALADEAAAKRDRASERRVAQAHFPYIKTLDAYQWSHAKEINRDLVKHFFNLQFIETHRNIAFVGGCGLGKTHLAIALAYHACTRGHSVRFDTAIDIINRLDTAQKTGTFVRTMRTYTGPELLVIDEIGYLPIDQRGADMLFQVISARYERGSIIITSNRAFKEWAVIFNNDRTIASAVLDRLLHHCDPVLIEGRSYRMKDRHDN